MWNYIYKKKKNDRELLEEKVDSGKGIVGCEMHELNGWGESHHRYKREGNGYLRSLFSFFFKTPYKNKE